MTTHYEYQSWSENAALRITRAVILCMLMETKSVLLTAAIKPQIHTHKRTHICRAILHIKYIHASSITLFT